MPTVKKLQFASGTAISPPTDLSIESSTRQIETYDDDAAYAADNSVAEGSIYLNSTTKAPRMYLGGVWRDGLVQQNPTDPTKTVKFDLDGASANADHILDFNGTFDRTYTFPDESGTVVLTVGFQDLEDKTLINGFLDGTKIKNGVLDVDAAGPLKIAENMGPHTLQLGGATSAVVIPGGLVVEGTTTNINSQNLNVEDKNITVNKNGTDITSEGAGLTVERDGVDGSLIYKDSALNKFAIGALGSEKDIATLDDISVDNLSGTILPSNGGTGVSNNDAATLTRVGDHAVTLTTTGTTSLTLPESGTLATTDQIIGSGVGGPAVSTENAIALWDNTTGTLLKNSSVIVDAATVTAGEFETISMKMSGSTISTDTVGTDINLFPAADGKVVFVREPVSRGNLGYTLNNLTNTFKTQILPDDLTADRQTTLPDASGEIVLDSAEQSLLNKTISSTAALTGALKLPVGDESERPSGQDGLIRFNSDSNSFEGYSNGDWSGIGGGGTTDKITQVGHSLVVGDVLYLNGSTYAKALATAANTAEVVGVVSRVIDVDTFELTLSGEVEDISSPSPLFKGRVYFLSDVSPGVITLTEPTVVGHVSVPIGVASSTSGLYVAPKRGSVVGSSNVRTEISLANNATTTVQDISAYEAGELTGWVTITATTPLRFYVAAQFSKNGAANNYNVSYQVSGDTPPDEFVVSATAAGLLQVTLPSIAGFASASINYALNAPAVGTSFPLSVQSSSIVWSEPVAFRNKIINGNFDIWQRGTSQTANGYGSDDRWVNENFGSTKTASRQSFVLGQTDVPGNPSYFSRTITTSVAGANNYIFKSQRIENVRTFAGQTVTLSFWAKADASRNMAIEFAQWFGSPVSGGSAAVTGIGSTTCALTTAWKKFTITITLPSISGKTIGTSGDDALYLNLWFDAGSSFNSRTNSLGQQSGTFDIAQVQLEAGSVATPFEQRPIGTELALCQRYYYRIPSSDSYAVASIYDTNGRCVGAWQLPVTMRAVPVFQNVGTSTISYINTSGTATAVSSFVTTYANTNMVAVNVSVSGRTTVGSTNLLTIASGAVVGAEAEL